MTNNNPKPFQRQFCECAELGFHKETEFIPFDTHPELMPFLPTKEMSERLTKEEWKGVTLIKCGKFGGRCHSQNIECRKLREGIREITEKMTIDLQNETGLGLHTCRQALLKTNGDHYLAKKSLCNAGPH